MKEKARSDLAVETWNALKGASWPMFTAIGERTHKAGTTTAQISLLNVLYDSSEDMTPLAVARLLHVTPGTVTGTLNRLEETGLIERGRGESKDRRVIYLRITPKGRDLVKRWRESCRAYFEEITTPLSDQELRTLIVFLSRLNPPISGVPGGLASLIKIDPGKTRPKARGSSTEIIANQRRDRNARLSRQ
jgi:DNA-binding MarR family transcriptional regulator